MNKGSLKSMLEIGFKMVTDSTAQLASNEVCSSCKKSIPVAKISLRLAAYERCRVCSKYFCGNCIQKMNVPKGVLTHEFSESDDAPQWICLNSCLDIVKEACMRESRRLLNECFDENLSLYCETGESHRLLFHRPGPSEDTLSRKAMRLAQVVGKVFEYTGYATTVKLIRYAYYSKDLYQKLIAGDTLKVLGVIYDEMVRAGARDLGPRGIIHLYYLACHHELILKTDLAAAGLCFEDGDLGVVASSCPLHVLDLVGAYADVAMWMYCGRLPEPHTDSDWSSWYLSQLVSRQRWTLLACINEATSLPNGQKCPGFALAVRNRTSAPSSANNVGKGASDKPEKEVLLVIQGTRSTLDVTINLQERPVPFSYFSNSASSNVDHNQTGADPGTHVYTEVHGFVHAGMLASAHAILDGYGMSRRLQYLGVEMGYSVTVVGHSLGAGVAALIAAELSNSFRQTGHAHACAALKAVTFGTPPCVSDTIAEAMQTDSLVYAAVNGFDVIPQLSKRNMFSIVQELQTHAAEATESYAADYASLKAYAASLGRAVEIRKDKAAGAESSDSTHAVSDTGESGKNADIASMDASNPSGQDAGGASTRDVDDKGNDSVSITDTEKVGTMTLDFFDEPLFVPGKIVRLHRSNGQSHSGQ